MHSSNKLTRESIPFPFELIISERFQCSGERKHYHVEKVLVNNIQDLHVPCICFVNKTSNIRTSEEHVY